VRGCRAERVRRWESGRVREGRMGRKRARERERRVGQATHDMRVCQGVAMG